MFEQFYNIMDVWPQGLRISVTGALLSAIGITSLLTVARKQREGDVQPLNFTKSSQKRFGPGVRVFFLVWTGIAIGMTLLSLAFVVGESNGLRRQYSAGDYLTVEGYVEQFEPMPYSGHQMETFEVDGVRFEYSDYVLNAGFNNTRSHGGPIDEGVYVRIDYIDNHILALWVLRE